MYIRAKDAETRTDVLHALIASHPDAPQDYIDTLAQAIVGIEIPLTRIEGKWKLNQSNPLSDRQRMAADLSTRPDTAPLGQLIAQRLAQPT